MAIGSIILLAKIFVFNERGETLLLRRSRTDRIRPLGWDLPGGNVEQNEDPNRAVLRELQEEAGLTATDSQVFHVATETKDRYIVTLLYKGKAVPGDVVLSVEHEQHRWIRPQDITAFTMPDKYTQAAHFLLQTGV